MAFFALRFSYMLRYFYGEDVYAARQAITDVAYKLNAKIAFLDRSDVEREDLASRAEKAASSLFGKTLLVTYDPSSWPKGLHQALAGQLTGLAKKDVVLWDRVVPDKRSELWKLLQPYAQEFVFLDDAKLAAWIESYIKDQGGTIEGAACRLLSARLGKDRFVLEQEIAKLLLMDITITAGRVEREIEMPAAEGNVFVLLDALAVRNAPVVLRALDALLTKGDSPLQILSLVGYQLRLLLAIRSGMKRHFSHIEVAQAYGFKPYPVQKNWNLAARFSHTQLLDMYTRVLACDAAVKGRIEPRVGLTMLLLGMSQQK